MYIAQSISQKRRFCIKIKCFSGNFHSVFLLKSIFCGLLCKITKKVVQIVKNKNFLSEIKSRTPKKRSFIYIA